MNDAEATDEFLKMRDQQLAQALYRRYMEARSFFDRAVDDRNQALQEAKSWKLVAEGRVHQGFAAVVAFGCFTFGLLLGIALQWVGK